jgi:hypothetical protein
VTDNAVLSELVLRTNFSQQYLSSAAAALQQVAAAGTSVGPEESALATAANLTASIGPMLVGCFVVRECRQKLRDVLQSSGEDVRLIASGGCCVVQDTCLILACCCEASMRVAGKDVHNMHVSCCLPHQVPAYAHFSASTHMVSHAVYGAVIANVVTYAAWPVTRPVHGARPVLQALWQPSQQ